MTETYPINQSHSNINKSSYKQSCDNHHKKGLSSSSLDSLFENKNYEIKSIIENEHDLSFSSDSNSELAETTANTDYLFNNKFWQSNSMNNSNYLEPKEKNKEIQSPIPIFKCVKNQSKGGVSEGSNKQSTQSNEDEEIPGEHLQNISSFESNNNSSSHNESEEKENAKKIGEIKNQKENSNNNNIQNLKYNNKIINEQEYIYPYENRNYKNNNIPFFQGVYISPQIYPFMPNFNYPSLNKKNFITNHNTNLNNKLEGNNSPEKMSKIN